MEPTGEISLTQSKYPRRVVTGHDGSGKSIVLSDGPPPQHHQMKGAAIGADFYEIWNTTRSVPLLTSTEAHEPNERDFTIMPVTGHLMRIIEIYPPQQGGKRTVMHRTKTLDYVVVIEGEVVLVLDDTEVALNKGDVVVQRGTDHAWENRADKVARMAFFHIDAEFSEELLAKLPKPLQLLR
jgi:quercetin dioxygenase-like cupin family protein